ncbi:LmbE family N-acetylglucosaminyl deacetylase [Knoellia remsis]|uniref:LmbE family N-acetylglucosaminyl deacetylase n=2 Tax=Knoellia remsis TaxID=407159 RepID=A0A2T0TQA0_9MICO|nr:PIG-L family deacetylase [Knoellia remsis]PRY47819.1 LmbE family N-acetylglucosaminyl deacetylase [Knoellia remsis]
MATIVFVHAHPDDEASATSGSMTRLTREGHRVVVVYGTGGEHGTSPDDLPEGMTLADFRRGEAEASARVTGAERIVWLGYEDSGMHGWEQNGGARSFHGADLDEAARRLADVLDEEDADVAIGYDWHGGYGHPDHVKVHRVVHRAADLAAQRPRLLESTMNRDAMRAGYQAAKEAGHEDGFDPDEPMGDGEPVGTPESEIHWRVDVLPDIESKRAALACHASQTSDVGMMLQLPAEMFAQWFGTEYYIEPGRAPGIVDGWPFTDLD